jgi:hypothetical protein
VLSDILDPFADLSPDQNLLAFVMRDKKRGSARARDLAEACR